ncbi:hypothetical protein [Paracoccus aestuarii]|uniref:hypothetical protein n=1 Tax=Paracoccus aestuarii TaxID=453842 RepID=UPI0011C47207|nr:hypothetical protein [Paracoccus aestuarii]WCQ98538.1 hypothetical protein JHW48_11580 [Paracoccus aestuarii]
MTGPAWSASPARPLTPFFSPWAGTIGSRIRYPDAITSTIASRSSLMFRFLGSVAGIIFLIGLLVVIGILSLIF